MIEDKTKEIRIELEEYKLETNRRMAQMEMDITKLALLLERITKHMTDVSESFNNFRNLR